MNPIYTKIWMRSLPLSVAAIGAVASLIRPVSAQQASVTVNVSGLHSQRGNVVVCLWNQQDKEFPICSNTASFRHATVKATASTVTATFESVAPGEYAISAFHDENQNGKIDRGFMGRPKEGIAFSNANINQDKRSRPSLDKAKFTVNGAKTISLSLMYF